MTPKASPRLTPAPAVVAPTGYGLAWCGEHRKYILSLDSATRFGGCWDCERAAGRLAVPRPGAGR